MIVSQDEPASGRCSPLTKEQVCEVKRLRYVEQWTCGRVAQLFGVHEKTIQRLAPGRVRNVSNARLREAVLASSMSWAEIARGMGWEVQALRTERDRTVYMRSQPDTSRVQRAIGLRAMTSGNGSSLTTTIRSSTAARMVMVLGLDPVDIDL